MGEHGSKEMGTASERAVLHSILDFLTKRPETLFGCMPAPVAQSFEALQEELENIVPLIADEDEMIRSFASTIMASLTSREFLVALGHDVQASWNASSSYLCRKT